MHANQIEQCKDQVLEGAAEMFGAEPAAQTVLSVVSKDTILTSSGSNCPLAKDDVASGRQRLDAEAADREWPEYHPV